jgi:hypothetical protein
MPKVLFDIQSSLFFFFVLNHVEDLISNRLFCIESLKAVFNIDIQSSLFLFFVLNHLEDFDVEDKCR